MFPNWALFTTVALAGCTLPSTFVECTSCRSEPYVALTALRFQVHWYDCEIVGPEAGCPSHDEDVLVTCVAPCAGGECPVRCETSRQPRSDPDSIHQITTVTVEPTTEDGTAWYEGPIRVEIGVRASGTEPALRYRSPILWFSGRAMSLVCVDLGPGVEHRLRPCSAPELSANRPLFGIAHQRQRLFHLDDVPTPVWRVLETAVVNGRLVSASQTVLVEDEEFPLFSLGDLFPAFRTAGGGVKPARYTLTIATPPRARHRGERTIEVDVR
jgi:hypothetical protein